MLSCGALIDGVRQFPGPWALVPVGAAVVFILAGANRADGVALPLPNRLLATAPLVRLGEMAYSLYLWHWPLLIFWLAYTGHAHANVVEGTAVLLVSGVLAYLTNRYIEEPLRQRKPANAAPETTVVVVPWRTRLRRPDDGAGIGGRAAGRDAHRDGIHLARARQRRTCQRQGTQRSEFQRLPRRSRIDQAHAGAPAAHAADGAGSPDRLPAVHPRRLHQ